MPSPLSNAPRPSGMPIMAAELRGDVAVAYRTRKVCVSKTSTARRADVTCC